VGKHLLDIIDWYGSGVRERTNVMAVCNRPANSDKMPRMRLHFLGNGVWKGLGIDRGLGNGFHEKEILEKVPASLK
jgi:hypothetical protein